MCSVYTSTLLSYTRRREGEPAKLKLPTSHQISSIRGVVEATYCTHPRLDVSLQHRHNPPRRPVLTVSGNILGEGNVVGLAR